MRSVVWLLNFSVLRYKHFSLKFNLTISGANCIRHTFGAGFGLSGITRFHHHP